MELKLKKGDNRRLIEGTWHFWGDHTPEQVDGNPVYFDKVVEDLRSNDPWSSCGTTFKLLLGRPGDFLMAEFVVVDVKKVVTQRASDTATEASFFRPVVKRVTDWIDCRRDTGAVRWNPGKKVHEVVMGDQVLFASPDKAEAEARLVA